MSLKDFLQELKEQDDSDVIYSKDHEDSIKILPPEKSDIHIDIEKENTTSTKIIPPESSVIEETKPLKIKFKINIPKEESNNSKIKIPEKKKDTQIINKQKKEEKIVKKEIDPVEELFRKSGTNYTKRNIWYEYYNKAQASRKQNSTAKRLREGKFAIMQDNQVLLLPDYDVRKSVNEILQDKWL